MEISFAGTSSSANAHGNGSWLTIVVVLGNVKSFTVFTKKGCRCAKRRFLANPEAGRSWPTKAALDLLSGRCAKRAMMWWRLSKSQKARPRRRFWSAL